MAESDLDPFAAGTIQAHNVIAYHGPYFAAVFAAAVSAYVHDSRRDPEAAARALARARAGMADLPDGPLDAA